MSTEVAISDIPGNSLQFHLVHAFVDKLETLDHYKEIEKRFNSWHDGCQDDSSITIEKGRELYQKVSNTSSLKEFSSVGQDIVAQLITGMSFRIIATYEGSNTRSFLLSTKAPLGARYLVSAPLPGDSDKPIEKKQKKEVTYDHFDRKHLDRFAKTGRPGFAVLCFQAVGEGVIEKILSRYKEKHPKLLLEETFHEYNNEKNETIKVLDAFAFYNEDKSGPDKGTVLRFVHHVSKDYSSLPGLKSVEAKYPKNAVSLYSDHWVSNVHDRNEYIKTLSDTLGFTPKVNFNAGVVAAGNAMIESTVAGNDPSDVYKDVHENLISRSQIYLPINNALSEAGHVFLYLKEIGQGVQHIASRTQDVASFIQQCNDTRKMTGYGFSFLNIPRSYYGRLTKKDLCAIEGVSEALALRLLEELSKAGYMTETGIINLDITNDKIASVGNSLNGLQAEFKTHCDKIQAVVRRGIYRNLYSLLGDRFKESEYLKIVRNKILIDIQGRDILYQIFTSCVLQTAPGTEAPFIEVIERICGDHVDEEGNALPIKPGCGGFGIRNFLTLFLSIEVTHAMNDLQKAKDANDVKTATLAQEKVDLFEHQLNEANPILTTISDAMTAEEDVSEKLANLDSKLEDEKKKLEELLQKHREDKERGQKELQVCAAKYKKEIEVLIEKMKAQK